METRLESSRTRAPAGLLWAVLNPKRILATFTFLVRLTSIASNAENRSGTNPFRMVVCRGGDVAGTGSARAEGIE
jgi:hypothetical protein